MKTKRKANKRFGKRPKKVNPVAQVCIVKPHFDCDGTGRMCDRCGESEAACRCDEDDGEQQLSKCAGCDGSTFICVAHDSACGTATGPCDAARKAVTP